MNVINGTITYRSISSLSQRGKKIIGFLTILSILTMLGSFLLHSKKLAIFAITGKLLCVLAYGADRYPEFSLLKRLKKEQRGEDQPLLSVACIIGDIEGIKWLLKQGADPNERGYIGFHLPIELASTTEAVRLLVEAGAIFKNTLALHEAVRRNDLECSAYLLSIGADPNFQDEAGDTPLHFAARDINMEMVALLLRCNGIRLVLNKDKRTPYKVAKLYNSPTQASLAYTNCEKN